MDRSWEQVEVIIKTLDKACQFLNFDDIKTTTISAEEQEETPEVPEEEE